MKGKIDHAMERFSAALDLLENSVSKRLETERASAETASERDALKNERNRLAARISALEEETRSLAGITSDVEERLDGAIAEIRQVLGRN